MIAYNVSEPPWYPHNIYMGKHSEGLSLPSKRDLLWCYFLLRYFLLKSQNWNSCSTINFRNDILKIHYCFLLLHSRQCMQLGKHAIFKNLYWTICFAGQFDFFLTLTHLSKHFFFFFNKLLLNTLPIKF